MHSVIQLLVSTGMDTVPETCRVYSCRTCKCSATVSFEENVECLASSFFSHCQYFFAISGDQVMFCSCTEVTFFLYGYALAYYTVRDLERFIASSCITLGCWLCVSFVLSRSVRTRMPYLFAV